MNRRVFFQDSLMGFAGLSGLVIPVSRPGSSSGRPITDAGASLKTLWPANDSRLFYNALEDGVGFSFDYGDEKGVSTTAPAWKTSIQGSGDSVETTFRHPSGLTVVRKVRAYPEYEAFEYTVTYRNKGASTLPALSAVSALDLKFRSKALVGAHVISSGGGMSGSTYPPEAYALRSDWIGPMTPLNGHITLATDGGRSSNKNLPFYFVQNDREGEGIFVAIGWSGQWSSTISGDYRENTLRVLGGIPDLHIQLRPGEEIRGPKILIGSYQGELSSGSNRLRGLIRSHFTPLLGGKSFEPVVTYDTWWNIGVEIDENLLKRVADAAAQVGQEYFLLDAGWYMGTDGPQGFSGGVGNWEEVDRKRFPSGLGAFANFVRSKGLRFGLWFEPERVARGTILATRHPEWVSWLPQNSTEHSFYANPNYGLLDYGLPEVQEWVRNMLDGYIRQLDIRYIRYDFNIEPLPYWKGKDANDHQGMSQIRHIEGLYRVLDWIREHHPATVLEGCAGGGRRIDLETASRFHTFWISDQTADPHIVRFHLEGMNHFLPGNYGYVCYILPLSLQEQFQPTDFGIQSFFGGAFGTGGRIDNWSTSMKELVRRHVSVYRRIRRFLVGDYYLLTCQPRDLHTWEGWQFHDPKTDEGFVQVFRVEPEEESKRFFLKALDPAATYQFSDPYSGRIFQLPGGKAISEGLEFHIAKMSSQILTYNRLGRST